MIILQYTLITFTLLILALFLYNQNEKLSNYNIAALMCLIIAIIFSHTTAFKLGQTVMEWEAIQKGYGRQEIITSYIGNKSIFKWNLPPATYTIEQNPIDTQIGASDTLILPTITVKANKSEE